MSYPMTWLGSTEADDKTGTATFMVDGEEFTVTLPSFATACDLNKVLDLAFKQGKRFMADAMDNAVNMAIEKCIRDRDAERKPAAADAARTPHA